MKNLKLAIILLITTLAACFWQMQKVTSFIESFDHITTEGAPKGWTVDSLEKYPTSKKPRVSIDLSTKKQGHGSLKLVHQQKSNELRLYPMKKHAVTPNSQYKMSIWVKNGDCKFRLTLSVYDARGNALKKSHVDYFITPQSTFDWKKFEMIVAFNKDEVQFKPVIHINHKCTIWLDDLLLEPHTVDNNNAISFLLYPNYFIDNNIYYLPKETPQIIRFAVKNPRNLKPQGIARFVLDLPIGVKLIGADHASKALTPPTLVNIEGGEFIRYIFSLGYAKNILRNKDFLSHVGYRSLDLVLQGKLPISDDLLTAYIHYEDDKKKFRPIEFKLKVIPAIKASRIPKRIFTGVSSGTSLEFYGKPLEAFADYYRKIGFSAIHTSKKLRSLAVNKNRSIRQVNQAFKKRGVTIFCNPGLPFSNAYNLFETGSKTKIPEKFLLKQADGITKKNTYDPAYIIQDGSFYRKELQSFLHTIKADYFDHLQPNWEPYQYGLDGGSFTTRSMEGFATYMKVPYKQIKNDTPKEIITKYKEKLITYQNWQLHKTNEIIKQEIDKFSLESGRKMMFIPMVGPTTIADNLPNDKWKREYFKTVMIADSLPYLSGISSWEYPHFRSNEYSETELYKLGYRRIESAKKGIHNTNYSATLERVEKITGWLNEQAKKRGTKPMPYFHLNQGLQVKTWVIEPRAVGIQMLAAFIGGAQGISSWEFPMGYDGRYWQSAAKANDLIAFYEDFVIDGSKAVQFLELTPVTKLFKTNGYKHFLQNRVFKYQGKYLLVLMNFDLLDKAIFSLNVSALPVGNYVLHDPYNKTAFSLNGKVALSLTELQEMVLSLPYNSIEFLVLEPYTSSRNFGRKIDTKILKRKLLNEIPQLDKKFNKRLKKIEYIISNNL